ncbi:MAG: hypothetical protein ACYCS9_04590 [Candidatus Dormibacteria bacterium]
MLVILTLLVCLLALAFLGTLAIFLVRIVDVLQRIGSGGQSSLEMIAWGVRAIEVETGHIPTQVIRLNRQLEQVEGGLQRIDQGLKAVAVTATTQRSYQ